ncbi:G-patch domain and KOW motifs-containing protein-like [Sabethes cyaneus]|uniref:G-patch domain and KOW motifs-containing protein-like n=1 Tax=Sabethes cyaneus TaxID=53552 RepID=UPI00237EDC30|nr:G-patch domain and KOW motifs-containing protein-like [Sabethes cyaneus]
MAEKKISFGFSKIAKKVNLQAGPAAISSDAASGSDKGKDGEKIEMIACLEGQAIRIVGKENGEEEPAPLVIPLREQDKTTIPVRLAKLQKIKDERETDRSVPAGEETLEQKAARELLEAAREHKNSSVAKNDMVIALKPEDLPLEGGQPSSLADYEAMPPEKFGLALLRGMGFKEDPNAPKPVDKLPEVRPKGMGLGAERAPKGGSRQLIPPGKDEVLVMAKGAFVKVLAGKHKDSYGTVESLNEDTSRVLIRFALGGNQESLNEYLLQLVSKAEYSKYSKVLNNAKYEEFKNRASATNPTASIKKEEERDERKIKREPSDSPPPKPQSSASSNRQKTEEYSQHRHRHRDKSPSPSRHDHRDRRDDRGNNRDSRRYERSDRSDKRDRYESRRARPADSSQSEHRSTDDNSPADRNRSRHRHKSSSSSYGGRTSSGTKKKSHKYKQRRDHSRERLAAAAAGGGHSGSDEDDRHHKKKTKKSKKQRSRSRSRR